jgi:site-specific DNA-methyltransferase (adenine-specific)
MDCIELLKSIESNMVDLVVTSPPYNCGIKYDTHTDNMEWDAYYEWCQEWLTEMFRVLKDDGRVCLVHYLSSGRSNNRHAPLMKINTIAEHIGYKHHGVVIWWDTTLSRLTAWGSWLSASAPYVNSPFEGILLLYKNRWKKIRKGVTHISKEEFIEGCSGIWKIQPEKNRKHPAPFPVQLAERCIKLFSWEGDLVLDPFIGSGTTAVACLKNNRHFIGCDISKQYVTEAITRIGKYEKTIGG